jgi:FkbM family methyltransferase
MLDPRLHRVWPAALRRAGLARRFNYVHPLSMSERRFNIPIEGGLGEALLKLKPDFKSDIVALFADSVPAWFIDVGANVGQTIVETFAARSWDRYFALEPDAVAAAYLRRLVDLNNLPVDVLPWAAGKQAGACAFYSKGVVDASATMAPDGRPGAYQPEMMRWVSTYPLDRLLEMATLPKGLMIKIDVEGFEPDVLEGAGRILTSLRPLVICEVLRAYSAAEVEFTHVKMGRLERILSAHHYRVFYIEMEGEESGRLRSLREMTCFPRGEWRDNPSGADYLFAPAELALPFATGRRASKVAMGVEACRAASPSLARPLR